MAWSAGHTHEYTMTTIDWSAHGGASTSLTMLFTQAAFHADDHDALATALNEGTIEVECAIDSGGATTLTIDVLMVDVGADTFVIRVGPITTPAGTDTLYWRYGGGVSQTATDAYDANWEAYWPLDDVNDQTVNANHLTAFDQAAPTTGGKIWDAAAYVFDGEGDSLLLGSAVASAYAITMMCWFKADDTANKYTLVGLVAEGSNSDYLAVQALGTEVGDPVHAVQRQSGGAVQAVTTNGFAADTWSHATGVFVGDTERYAVIDGDVPDLNEDSEAIPDGLSETSLGILQRSTPVDDFAGDLCDVSIHSTERAAAWIDNERGQASLAASGGAAAAGAGKFTAIGGGGFAGVNQILGGGILVA